MKADAVAAAKKEARPPEPAPSEGPLASLVQEVPPPTPVTVPEPPARPSAPKETKPKARVPGDQKPGEKKKSSLGLVLGILALLVLLLVGAGVAAVLYVMRHRAEPSPEPPPATLLAAPSPEAPSPVPESPSPAEEASPLAEPSPVPESTASPEATASPTPRPVPVVGTVAVTSQPPGARVTLGTQKGVTPFRATLKPGKVVVTVEKDGYNTWTQEVTVKAGAAQSLRAVLVATAPSVAAPAPATPPPAVVKPGDLVPVSTPDLVAPKRTAGIAPETPSNRPKGNTTITVIMSFTVNTDGTISDPKVVQSGGTAFDQACFAALKGWKYTGGTLHGIPVRVEQQARFVFEFR
jgi:TonB family protein